MLSLKSPRLALAATVLTLAATQPAFAQASAPSGHASCWLRLPTYERFGFGGMVDVATLRAVSVTASATSSAVTLQLQFREGSMAEMLVTTSREAAQSFLTQTESLLSKGCAHRP